MSSHEAEVTVLSGLPITCGFSVAPPDRSVGISSAYVEDWWIEAINGRKAKHPEWLVRRIQSVKGEEERLTEKLMEHAEAGPDPDYYRD